MSDLDIASLHAFFSKLAFGGLDQSLLRKKELAFIVDVAGLVSGRGPELQFCDFDAQIGECLSAMILVSFFGTSLRGLICDACRENQASSIFLVSFLNLAPRAHLRCLSRKSSFVDVSGLVSELGSEGLFAMPVERIKLRRFFWPRF